jgi:hypothetical protein
MKLNHYLAYWKFFPGGLGEGVGKRRERCVFREFNIYFENISANCQVRLASLSSTIFAARVELMMVDVQVIMSITPHEILDGVEWRIVGRICIATDARLCEMSAVTVGGVELFAKVDN